jgi:hypothetical protein
MRCAFLYETPVTFPDRKLSSRFPTQADSAVGQLSAQFVTGLDERLDAACRIGRQRVTFDADGATVDQTDLPL